MRSLNFRTRCLTTGKSTLTSQAVAFATIVEAFCTGYRIKASNAHVFNFSLKESIFEVVAVGSKCICGEKMYKYLLQKNEMKYILGLIFDTTAALCVLCFERKFLECFFIERNVLKFFLSWQKKAFINWSVFPTKCILCLAYSLHYNTSFGTWNLCRSLFYLKLESVQVFH